MKKQYIIPIFVPHWGCSNECTFCNQKKISGQKKPVSIKEVKKQIEYYLANFDEDAKDVEIAFFGGSFTAIEKSHQEELLQTAYEYIKQKKVKSIRISTRPDCIDRKKLKLLKKYKVKTIELGVQSADNDILEACKRGHTFEDVKKASRMIRWHRFTLGHQMMVGLPESTAIDEIKTARKLAKLKPKIMRIYPVLVIRGTELEQQMLRDEYEPLTVEQAVERTKELVNFFNKKKIKVIRIGLQNTDTICDPSIQGSEVVAGPYHECFRQLVESAICYDNIVNRIKKVNSKVKEIEVTANPKTINNVVGYKRGNIEKLKSYYDVDLKVVIDSTYEDDKMDLKVTKEYKDFLGEDERNISKKNSKKIK